MDDTKKVSIIIGLMESLMTAKHLEKMPPSRKKAEGFRALLRRHIALVKAKILMKGR